MCREKNEEIFGDKLIKKIYIFKKTAKKYIKNAAWKFSFVKKFNFLIKSNIFKFPVAIFAHALKMNWIFTSKKGSVKTTSPFNVKNISLRIKN